jgi:3-hydroxyisobutyrate dehydrogenase-like beta-hydroxyacid dehydrogenase
MQVGVVGAGLMGHGMAANLLKHGHGVTVIAHRNRKPVDDLVSKGAREACDIAELAEADAILLCVTTSKVVADTIAKLRPHLRPGQIILDSGTSAPDETRRLAHDLEAMGVGFADIPLTGGPEQAEKGELGVLCGASDKTFAAIKPLLDCFATTVRHFGPPGSGHTAKLISNYLVTGMVALVAEAFGAAHRAQVDWKDLYEVMLNGSGNSGVLRKMAGPAVADGDYDGYRFAIANAAKDLGYYRGMAGAGGFLSPLAETLGETWRHHLEARDGEANVSRLIEPEPR